MTRARFLIAAGLGLALISAAVQAQTIAARGLDFTSFIRLERGMTEGQVIGIAGRPDLRTDQGFAQPAGSAGNTLVVKTYTYLPTSADPYTTTITLVGGRVTDIQRDATF